MEDVRKEQVVLLRFEKQIAGLAATLIAGGAVAQAVDGKLAASEGVAAFDDIQAALVNLAEVTGQAHEALNAVAADAGAQVLQATGGIPKVEISKVVSSILGLG